MRIARLICFVMLAAFTLLTPAQSNAQVAVGISVQIGPPALPIYEQPVCPGYGYIWTPGYWAYGYDGYYWVPGTWVLAPAGMLWTPGYWAWENAAYVWYPGYWGPEVGFYGGINYGFGYGGIGYEGGYWRNDAFYYNRSVNNITNVTNITNVNVYNKSVSNNMTVTNVSYNGGPGGTTARPTAQEQAAARAPHTPPTTAQVQHEHAASSNRAQFASVNQGKPEIAATDKPGEFSGRGVIAAKAAAPYRPTPNPAPGKAASRPEKSNRPENPAPTMNPQSSNPREPLARPETPRGNAPSPLEMRHQQEIQKLQQKQDQERQSMQQKHQQEVQKLQQRGADQPRQQELQQRHQQQMQQLEQKHSQQQQQLQQRQQAQQKQEPQQKQEQRKQ